MSIALNGTTGITTPDVTSDGSLKIDASAPDDSLVVDANGNVGIGTSSPSTKLDVIGVGRVSGNFSAGRGNTNSNILVSSSVANGGTGFSEVYFGNASTNTRGYISYQHSNDSLQIGVAATERVRIDSSGNLLVGTTSTLSSSKLSVNGLIGAQLTYGPMYYSNENNTDNVGRGSFTFNRGGSLVGQIVTTNSTCTYTSVSDYRLKEDWQPMTGASERVKALKPVNFAWKLDGSRIDGFLAHEAQAVVPEAVTGAKDATEMVDIKDEDGNVTGQEERPVYQGIDQSKLVPLLTAALQEALAKIEDLTARVVALEGQP